MGQEREIARGRLRMTGTAPAGDGAPAVVEPPEPIDAEGQLRLRERIAREINLAGPAMPELYPVMDGRPGEGGDAGQARGSG